MAQEPVVNVWEGSATWASSKVPFGYFNSDSSFQSDIVKFSDWAAKRLGYPITDVELIDQNFFAAYEEAVMYFGYMVNGSKVKDILFDVRGTSTDSSLDLSTGMFSPNLRGIFKLAQQYGNAGPGGGSQIWYSGSIDILAGKQTYDLKTDTELEEGDPEEDLFTIKKLFHYRIPASRRIYGVAGQYGGSIIQEFGFDRVSGMEYMMYPLNYNLQLQQAVELTDAILKSQYSFKITGSRIQIFPIPREDGKLWFNYVLDEDDLDAFLEDQLMGKNTITGIADIPFEHLNYSRLNSIAKMWIKKYALALCKEMLGLIRSKYDTLPIPDTEITLNGSALVDQAKAEQEELTTKLSELLESLTNSAQLESRSNEADVLQNILSKVPTSIYIR